MEQNARLEQAIRNNDRRRLKDALAKGADPNMVLDQQGRRALYHAAAAGSIEMVRLLLDAGAKVSAESGSTSLHAAAARGDLPMLEMLIGSVSKRVLNKTDSDGYTPLMSAIAGGQIEAAKVLLAAGADPNAHEDSVNANTAIRIAAADGTLDMAKLLLAAGADPLIPGRMGLTALDRARERHTPMGRMITVAIERWLEQKQAAAKAPQARKKAPPARKEPAKGKSKRLR